MLMHYIMPVRTDYYFETIDQNLLNLAYMIRKHYKRKLKFLLYGKLVGNTIGWRPAGQKKCGSIL